MNNLISKATMLVMALLVVTLATTAGRPLLYDLCTEIVHWCRGLGIPIYTFDPVWTVFALLFFIGASIRFWNWRGRDDKWKESQKRRAKLFPRDPADDVPVHTGKRRADPDPPLKI